MPYQPGSRLPAERASRLSHLDVLNSPLVNKLAETFDSTQGPPKPTSVGWLPLPRDGAPLPIVLSVDGSYQTIRSDTKPTKEIAFVKTALLQLDRTAISRIDPESPHPMAVRDILADAAVYHATLVPLKNVVVQGMSVYDTVRQTIFESLQDASLDSEPLATLKWLLYEKWDGGGKSAGPFLCPHCDKTVAVLPFDSDAGRCQECNGHLFVSDALGFHQDMVPDAAPALVATSYMNVHEVLLLFTAVRHYWEHDRSVLKRCLFVKDGPLYFGAQLAKLVNPIRRFFAFAKDAGCEISMIGQEKSGKFYDHLELLHKDAPENSYFIPNNAYIQREILLRNLKEPYGTYTNYGAKVFVKLNHYHHMVLTVPTGSFVADPSIDDLIGIQSIFATVPTILSNRYEGALLPIELAHGVASLATYPSNQVFMAFLNRLLTA